MDLSTKIAGIELKNPHINASGVMSSEAAHLRKLQSYDFAALVTKSSTKEPRTGNAEPTIIDPKPSIMLNRMGLPNPGVDAFSKELRKYKFKVPVIGSATGFSIDEFVYVAETLESVPTVKMIEVNTSCPNTDENIICFEKEFLGDLLKELDGELSKPYSVKLSPFTDFKGLRETIEIIEESKAQALVLTNTIPVRYEHKGKTYHWGQSGKSILGLSLRNVFEANKYTELDIIGCGGISGPKDVINYIHAGAKAVQMATIIQQGRAESIIFLLNTGLSRYMSENNFNSIEEFRGIN